MLSERNVLTGLTAVPVPGFISDGDSDVEIMEVQVHDKIQNQNQINITETIIKKDDENNLSQSSTTQNSNLIDISILIPGQNKSLLYPSLEGTKIRTKDVTALLLKFANFLTRSKGDIDAATEVYKKIVEVSV